MEILHTDDRFGSPVVPWALGWGGLIYGATAAIGGTIFIISALRFRRNGDVGRRDAVLRDACVLFTFSIFYLFVLFAALLVDQGHHRVPLALSASTASAAVQAPESNRVLDSVEIGRSPSQAEEA